MRNLAGQARSARARLRLPACWTTHSPTGAAVMPLSSGRPHFPLFEHPEVAGLAVAGWASVAD
jgi:hypothetical protein